jgi:NADH:ubiquinone oxidoreductase subunit B-like Fe-S oxidoreductase
MTVSKEIATSTKLTEIPAIEESKEFAFTTKLDDFINWSRKHSLWPLPFGTACCAIEYMSVVSSHYDVSRFGAEVVRFSPRQSDCMLVLGTVVEKMGPVLKNIYDQDAHDQGARPRTEVCHQESPHRAAR